MASTPGQHNWKFFRAGGVDQVLFRDGKDLAALAQLDQKLWMALSMPTRGVEFDARTADLLDTDKDGHLRPPEVLAAIQFAEASFADLGELMKGGDSVPLASIKDPELLAGAKRLLANLRKPEATALTLADVTDTHKLFTETRFNGDGVVPAETAEDEATRKAIEDAISVVGSLPDRSGKVGLDQAKLDAFFAQAKAWVEWSDKAPANTEALAALSAAVAPVKVKIDDYFTRCRLAAFDARSVGPLNREEKDYALMAGRDLSLGAAEVAALPLCKIEPAKPLALTGPGLNPAWAERLKAVTTASAKVLTKPGTVLTDSDWTALLGKLAPYEAWIAAKPDAAVEKLGLPRLRELLANGAQAKVAALIAQDVAADKEVAQLALLEKLVRVQRDLYLLLTNFVSFADFYGRKGAVFQAGTLYLDARTCSLCIEVADPARHAALAALSAAYLAYCDITRAGEPKRTIVAVFTDGDSDNLMVGRNGVFYDRKGRDWEATITKVVSNPISIREAFWLPYKKLVRLIEEQFSKRAQAAEAESMGKVGETATLVANVDKQPAPAPAPAKPAEAPRKLDLGTIALVGTAIGGISALVGGFLTSLFGLGPWMPVGLLGLLLLVSGPSMLLAWLKLRQRNLGPILDANGWAINTKALMNVPFGAALTHVARLPPHAERTLDDPFAEKKRPWKLYLTLGAIVLLGYLWLIGRLDPYLPSAIRNLTLMPPKTPASVVLPVVPAPAGSVPSSVPTIPASAPTGK